MNERQIRLSTVILAGVMSWVGLAACDRPLVPPPPASGPAGSVAPSAPPSPGPSPAVAGFGRAGGVGRIRGRVIYPGPPPARKSLAVTLDTHACGTEPKSAETLLVDPSGGVANAVVWLTGVDPGPMPATNPPPRIVQKRCAFSPHVVLVPKGGSIWLANEDIVTHNFRAAGRGENAQNFNQPGRQGDASVANTVTFPEAGIVPVECSFHYWMTGYVVVAAHRLYALTGPDGAFVLDAVPAGQRKLKVWHESMGTLTREQADLDFPVMAGADIEVDVRLAPLAK